LSNPAGAHPGDHLSGTARHPGHLPHGSHQLRSPCPGWPRHHRTPSSPGTASVARARSRSARSPRRPAPPAPHAGRDMSTNDCRTDDSRAITALSGAAAHDSGPRIRVECAITHCRARKLRPVTNWPTATAGEPGTRRACAQHA
jgi:hypothetical protein